MVVVHFLREDDEPDDEYTKELLLITELSFGGFRNLFSSTSSSFQNHLMKIMCHPCNPWLLMTFRSRSISNRTLDVNKAETRRRRGELTDLRKFLTGFVINYLEKVDHVPPRTELVIENRVSETTGTRSFWVTVLAITRKDWKVSSSYVSHSG